MTGRVQAAWTLALGALLAVAVSGGSAHAKPRNFEKERVPEQLIVKFKAGSDPKAMARKLELSGFKVLHTFSSSGAMLVESAQKAGDAKLLVNAESLVADKNVDYIEANTIIHIDSRMPNDARFGELYGMHNEGGTGGTADADIDAPEAWGITTGSRNVLVGIIDTGVDYNHPDIAPNYWTNPGESGLDDQGRDKRTNGIDDDGNGYIDDFRGWDFVNNDNDPMDDNDHGTHCAGTIGGAGDDGVGVVGVNWEVSMVGIKFLSGSGSGSLADAVKAIEYATSIGATLTSNSWGGGGYSDTMEAAIRQANERGVLFVAAAGNSGTNNDSVPHYPSSYENDNVIAVAATDHNDAMASFSCYGANSVDVAAPGVNILSSVAGDGYSKFSGTSMATPHVAGVAALVKAAYPDATASQIKARIMNTVDPVASLAGKLLTGGRVNAFNALEMDTVAPNAPGALSVESVGLTSVTLAFDAAGDDGSVGEARRYEVRVSETPIETDDDWSAATPSTVNFEMNGSRVTALISKLDFNFSGYLAVRAVDNVGNIGPVSISVPFQVRRVTKVMENGADSLDGITADSPWGLEETANGSVFSDSPSSSYANKANVAMTFDMIDAGSSDVTLQFDASWDLESGYDFTFVEISTDGTSWKQVDRLTGTSAWASKIYDLSGHLNGQTKFQLRFRLTSDSSITKDGIKIDRLTIFAPAE